jgi:hypothetical protein
MGICPFTFRSTCSVGAIVLSGNYVTNMSCRDVSWRRVPTRTHTKQTEICFTTFLFMWLPPHSAGILYGYISLELLKLILLCRCQENITCAIAHRPDILLAHCIIYDGRLQRGLTLLFRVGTLWRCSDGLFFEVPPLASGILLTTLHPLLENVLQTVDHFEISYLRAPFSWLEKSRNLMGRDLDCMAVVLMGFHRSTFSKQNADFNSDRSPRDFWAFPTMKSELRGKKFRSDERSAARFRELHVVRRCRVHGAISKIWCSFMEWCLGVE